MNSREEKSVEEEPALESVNYRLEKAINQLQLANEALRATRTAFWSLNNQLEMMNQEVEMLGQEVSRLREGYAHTLDYLPCPVVLVDKEGKVEVWNAAAQRLFHFATDAWVGADLSEMPVQPSLGQALRKKHRVVVERGIPLMMSNQLVHVKRAVHRMDVHFTSLNRDRSKASVLIMFMGAEARDGVVSLNEQKINLVDGAAS
jgi:nitrogen fixation/metabolism regulation signal transduction histidine kinase